LFLVGDDEQRHVPDRQPERAGIELLDAFARWCP